MSDLREHASPCAFPAACAACSELPLPSLCPAPVVGVTDEGVPVVTTKSVLDALAAAVSVVMNGVALTEGAVSLERAPR